MRIFIKIVVTAVAFAVASWLLDGIHIGEQDADFLQWALTLAVIAAIFGIVNSFIKPIIQVLGCGFYILTLGLFALVVNALLFMLVAWIADLFPGIVFKVDGFWWALLGSLLVTVTSWLINLILPDRVASDRP
jgi:putative membrane protein